MCQETIVEAIEKEASVNFVVLSKPVLSQFRVNLLAVLEVRNETFSEEEEHDAIIKFSAN